MARLYSPELPSRRWWWGALCAAVVLAMASTSLVSAQAPTVLMTGFNANGDIATSVALFNNQSGAYVASFKGLIYYVPLPITVGSTAPAPILTFSNHLFQVIQLNPAQDTLFLLDTQSNQLFSLSLVSEVLTPKLLCRFPGETSAGSLSSMVADFSQTPPIAYVTSRENAAVYAVNLTVTTVQDITDAMYTQGSYSGVTVVPGSGAGAPSTLWLAAPVVGTSSVVLSKLAVTGLTTTATTETVVTAGDWYYPDAVVVSQTLNMVYVTDGGAGGGGCSISRVESVIAVNLAASPVTYTKLYSATSICLKGGSLLLTNDLSTLLFTATLYQSNNPPSTLQQLIVNPSRVTSPLTSSPPGFSSGTLDGGIIAAIIIGLTIFICICCVLWRRAHRSGSQGSKQMRYDPDDTQQPSDAPSDVQRGTDDGEGREEEQEEFSSSPAAPQKKKKKSKTALEMQGL